MPDGEFHVDIKPDTAHGERLARITRVVGEHAGLRKQLGGADSRLLGVQLVDQDGEKSDDGRPRPETGFRATLYDYGNDRTIEATGHVDAPEDLQIEEHARQPLPNWEEIELALRHLADDEGWGTGLRDGSVKAMTLVPPVVAMEQPDGRTRRTIGVALMPRSGRGPVRVAAVDLSRKQIHELEPRGGTLLEEDCAPLSAWQQVVTNTYGQAWVSITQGTTTVWRMLVRRPAYSSGLNGSGVELRYVDYYGKRVLYQAHLPILNVRYDGDVCGPFRDNANYEGMFQADGLDAGDGFRLCETPATTIIDTGSDLGNFNGVAVYPDGYELVLLSEMELGWYRYVMSWRFHLDGTIKPRFGFMATQWVCTCNTHHHHAYWRLDFDVRSSVNQVSEFNDPPLGGEFPSNWQGLGSEVQRPRDPSRNRKWRVREGTSGAAYEIRPGPHDGVAASMPDWPYPHGDVWFVRYKSGAEIDDGVNVIGPPYDYDALIDKFVDGEPLWDRDVVMWYAAHFTHEPGTSDPHIVGPDLVPINF